VGGEVSGRGEGRGEKHRRERWWMEMGMLDHTIMRSIQWLIV